MCIHLYFLFLFKSIISRLHLSGWCVYTRECKNPYTPVSHGGHLSRSPSSWSLDRLATAEFFILYMDTFNYFFFIAMTLSWWLATYTGQYTPFVFWGDKRVHIFFCQFLPEGLVLWWRRGVGSAPSTPHCVFWNHSPSFPFSCLVSFWLLGHIQEIKRESLKILKENSFERRRRRRSGSSDGGVLEYVIRSQETPSARPTFFLFCFLFSLFFSSLFQSIHVVE